MEVVQRGLIPCRNLLRGVSNPAEIYSEGFDTLRDLVLRGYQTPPSEQNNIQGNWVGSQNLPKLGWRGVLDPSEILYV